MTQCFKVIQICACVTMGKIRHTSSKFDQPLLLYLGSGYEEYRNYIQDWNIGSFEGLVDTIFNIYCQLWYRFFKNILESSCNLQVYPIDIMGRKMVHSCFFVF